MRELPIALQDGTVTTAYEISCGCILLHSPEDGAFITFNSTTCRKHHRTGENHA